jgi:hypothetical protein
MLDVIDGRWRRQEANASEADAYITGTSVAVDGGLDAGVSRDSIASIRAVSTCHPKRLVWLRLARLTPARRWWE